MLFIRNSTLIVLFVIGPIITDEVAKLVIKPNDLQTMYDSFPAESKKYLAALIFRSPCWRLSTDANPIKLFNLTKVTLDLDGASVSFCIRDLSKSNPAETEKDFMTRMQTFLYEKGLISDKGSFVFGIKSKGSQE